MMEKTDVAKHPEIIPLQLIDSPERRSNPRRKRYTNTKLEVYSTFFNHLAILGRPRTHMNFANNNSVEAWLSGKIDLDNKTEYEIFMDKNNSGRVRYYKTIY